MWCKCTIVYQLLRLLSEAGFFTRAYADDVIIIIIADDQGIAGDLSAVYSGKVMPEGAAHGQP